MEQASIRQLKKEICELFGVDEDEIVLWDYYDGNKYVYHVPSHTQ